MNSADIRKAFIDYFAREGHTPVASSPLIPANDPTLLFTNAGMVQFKETFLGTEARSYTRAVTAQRCVRAGGKHNDLENVGFTARHHTFFEMLGNFSFGDYFKRDAIRLAWEFLTNVLHLPPERLWVTVYKDDEETAKIWLEEMGVSRERFSRCGEKDNFWSMGDTGPCGPCTEIFYDHGPDIPGGPPGSPDEDGDRYIEIWNLVFMQYNRDSTGKLHPLPKPSVDTGMGLERIAAVVQGVHNNYDIDSFQVLIRAIAALGKDLNLNHPSLKVVADHLRACAFLITDGVVPGNEGRGYVLRRIARRALRHGNKLGLPSPFFHRLVMPLVEVMGSAYPELADARLRIEQVLLHEENQFAKTLEFGLQVLKDAIAQLTGKILPGDVAFKLYDTYGFPLDLTADILREQGLSVDTDGFNRCMEQQRAQSQAASQFAADFTRQGEWHESSLFRGYTDTVSQAKVLAIQVNGERVACVGAGVPAQIVLNETPFYAESGGQVGDTGEIVHQGAVFRVEDTRRIKDAIVHSGVLLSGALSVDDTVEARVDEARRDAIRLNHSATHLLHAALKKILGGHVEQRGSLVDAARARFDFLHFEALSPETLKAVEALVNAQIRANYPVITAEMSIEDARAKGAVALFGEKYGESVRVLSMGDFSMELCGGTHARRTGDIGLFKIVAEYGVASGVRRIEMLTGADALAYVNAQQETLEHVAATLRTTPAQLTEKLSQFMHETKQLEKECQRLQGELLARSGDDMLARVRRVGDVNLLVERLESGDGQSLRTTLDRLRERLEQAVIVLFYTEGDSMQVVASVSKSLAGKVPSAATLVRHLCGKGGGREDMAQGGGRVPDDLNGRLDAIDAMIAGGAE